MDVQASPAELPELKDFLGALRVRFRRPEGVAALERYMTGRLTELPNKYCDIIARAVPGTSEQRLQEFLTTRQWDEEDLNYQRVQKMSAEATLGDGTLVLDDTGFAKQGKTSVRVARQYSGTRGSAATRANSLIVSHLPSKPGSGGRALSGVPPTQSTWTASSIKMGMFVIAYMRLAR
jgi:SRSO17 transposase